MIKNGILKLKKFSLYPEIVHGFSTQEYGDLKIRSRSLENKNLDKILNFLKIKKEQLVVSEQLHGRKVVIVNRENSGHLIPDADGLVTKDRGIFLGANTADCLPIFLYDPDNKIIGVCHAGWLGTWKEIIKEMIIKMESIGAQSEKTIAGIGPHIKGCCYDVPQKRVRLFQKKFGADKKMVKEKDGKFYLDLTYLNLRQLEETGVKGENIEVAPHCTCCCGKDFFSYRRQGSKNFSEMLGVIGRRE